MGFFLGRKFQNVLIVLYYALERCQFSVFLFSSLEFPANRIITCTFENKISALIGKLQILGQCLTSSQCYKAVFGGNSKILDFRKMDITKIRPF